MIGKKEMITQIVEHYNEEHEGAKLTKVAATEMYDAVFDTLHDMLTAGTEVAIPNLGRFKITERAERVAHNPKTMEEITVPAKKSVKFSVSKTLKDAVAEL